MLMFLWARCSSHFRAHSPFALHRHRSGRQRPLRVRRKRRQEQRFASHVGSREEEEEWDESSDRGATEEQGSDTGWLGTERGEVL